MNIIQHHDFNCLALSLTDIFLFDIIAQQAYENQGNGLGDEARCKKVNYLQNNF